MKTPDGWRLTSGVCAIWLMDQTAAFLKCTGFG